MCGRDCAARRHWSARRRPLGTPTWLCLALLVAACPACVWTHRKAFIEKSTLETAKNYEVHADGACRRILPSVHADGFAERCVALGCAHRADALAHICTSALQRTPDAAQGCVAAWN